MPRSIIVTGCQPWTVYNETSFEGDALCLFPSDTENCYPSFYETPQDLDGFANNIQSTRLGCFSRKILNGKSVARGELQLIEIYKD